MQLTHASIGHATKRKHISSSNNNAALATINAMNNPDDAEFEPTVFVSWDLRDMGKIPRKALHPYITWAKTVSRHPTDVAMITHLILYFTTSVPSAVLLYRNFSYTHAILHVVMQAWYIGTYTLMRHQHIHMGGILAKRFPYSLIDMLYPYILDPLHGHTWNAYYYHHIKHHHVEGNGPDDLSSTIRYQRDNVWHFLHYVARFFFLIWLDLPRYFIRKGRYSLAVKCLGWEIANLCTISALARWRMAATMFVFVAPLVMIRAGLMIGNWGQHALVDEVEPDSDFRSSITLLDVAVSLVKSSQVASPFLSCFCWETHHMTNK